MAVRIITDSTADFSAQEARALGVSVVPLNVNFGPDEVYRDGVDLDPQEFYTRLAAAEKLPTTSQPSPELFLSIFEEAKEAGDEVVAVLLSGPLSGTVQSAGLARGLCGYEEHIFVVDSLTATLGLKLLVQRALALRDEGRTGAEIAAQLDEEKHRIRLYAVVDTLKYLQKGGRLSAAVAVAGTLLGIKPVITIQDGKVGVAGKARGLPGAYVTIFKLITGEEGGIDILKPYLLGYTGHRRTVEPFYRYITETLHLPEPPVSPIGTVIGTHAGPGACGIAYFAAEKEEGESLS